jgi:hypothetical protein
LTLGHHHDATRGAGPDGPLRSPRLDLAVSDNGRFLYGLVTGTNTIAAFRVQADGSLVALPLTAGIPAGANGLAVR